MTRNAQHVRKAAHRRIVGTARCAALDVRQPFPRDPDRGGNFRLGEVVLLPDAAYFMAKRRPCRFMRPIIPSDAAYIPGTPNTARTPC